MVMEGRVCLSLSAICRHYIHFLIEKSGTRAAMVVRLCDVFGEELRVSRRETGSLKCEDCVGEGGVLQQLVHVFDVVER